MKVVALVSGGKDSCYNMQLCESYGHEIVALANLLPLHDEVDELDSFMYQTVGHQVVAAFAQCMGLPLFRRRIQGSPRAKDLRYIATEGDEVEDLEILLRAVKSRIPGLGGVSTGAIASDYQRLRVENVCSRLGLVSLAYMWKQDQASLLQNMVDSGLQAILVKVAAMGMDPHKHLGKDLATLQPLFLKLQDLYGCNVCGEGGEYESLTLDCPLFKNAKIVLDEFTIRLHSPDTIAPVGVLHPTKFHLEYKSQDRDPGLTEMLFEVADDFLANNIISETEVAASPTRSMPYQQTPVKSELLTNVIRQRHGFVAISCRQKSVRPYKETQCQLGVLLAEIENQLQLEQLSWADVLYVHLYLNDMKEFSKANEIYVQYITEKESVRGVPSRCCVELPLEKAGMGHVMVEILATTDSSKKVLHVQSISSWAPCCIGPYSQATQHQQVMYMAGQLGLDPPTMNVVPGGATCEMTQALNNCKAIGEVFTQTFLNSIMSLTVYCSSPSGMNGVEGILDKYLESFGETDSQGRILPKPPVLYILLPALPKGALLEVAPLTYIFGSPYDETGGSLDLITNQWSTVLSSGVEGFYSCKGHTVAGRFCRAFTFLSYRGGTADGISLSSLDEHAAVRETFKSMSNVLGKALLSWADVFVLRVYFVVDKISPEDLQEALGAMVEDSLFQNVPKPSLIPVLGLGDTAELQAQIAMEVSASGHTPVFGSGDN
ncbi:unnamed protein product [Calypogeia fissa]